MVAARAALGIIGGLLLVIGGIVALSQKAAADNAAGVDTYLNVYGLTSTAPPLYTAMWVATGFAGVGALMLIGLLIAIAAQPKKAPAPAEASTGAKGEQDQSVSG